MEKTLVLKAEVREHSGSGQAAKVRKKGRIPAIIYGHKQNPVAVSLDAHNLVEGLHHGHRVFDIQIGKNKETTMVKDLQYDHLGRDVIHVDLVRVDVTETVRIEVPIELKGTPKGSQEGGIIEEHADHLAVECRVTDIPENIVVSVKEMNIGDALHASDVVLPSGVKLISSPTTLLATCSIVAAAKTTEELEAEAPAAPEVIGEVKEEEAEEETPEEAE